MPANNQKGPEIARVLALNSARSRVPAVQIVRQRPIAAAISKAVEPTLPVRHSNDGTRMITSPGLHTLQQVSNQTATSISQSDTIMQMIPDMELGAQILISAVTSPKDMMTLELTYETAAGLLPPSIVASLVAALKSNFDNVYKIKNKIPRILREVLFDKGSHVVAIIPENSVDEMINRHNAISLESYNAVVNEQNKMMGSSKYGLATATGLLGPGCEELTDPNTHRSTISDAIFNAGLENFSLDGYSMQGKVYNQVMHLNTGLVKKEIPGFIALEGVLVTDNPNVLRGPSIERKLRADAFKNHLKFNRISAGLEDNIKHSGINLDDRSLKAAIYKSRKRGLEPMQVMKTDNQLERKSIGRPLVMELPPEAVIPVYTPGQEDKHVGYFILLDQSGNPVRAAKESDALGSMTNRLNNATSQQGNIVNRLRQLTEGFGCTNEQSHSEMMNRVYADMVEADLLARLRNGIYANSVALAKNPEYYRVMLTRVMQQQKTTILFMPIEMVTYFARKYNSWGVGVSILDDMKFLNNIRAITTIANTLLGISNSIPRTNIDLQLDETNPDPYKAAEMFVGEMMRANQTAVPLGASSPNDIMDYLQRAQYRVNIKGHPGLPDMNADYTETNSNYQRVDENTEKNLQDRAMMTMGLNSEIVNNGFNQETATSVVANNLMLSRRVAMLQEVFNPQITDYHRKIIRADEEILAELREILNAEYANLDIDEEEIRKELGVSQAVELKAIVIDHLISEFVESLEVSLPKPETATLENMKSAMQSFMDVLDIAIDAYIASEFFTDETGGELSRSVDAVKAMLRAYFVRRYMAENGVLPEIAAMVAGDDNDEFLDLWEEQSEYIKKLTRSMGGFMRKIYETKKAESESAQRMANDFENAGLDSSGGSSYGSDDNSSSSTGDDMFGGSDFSLGDDGGLGDLDDEAGLNELTDPASSTTPEAPANETPAEPGAEPTV